MEIEGLEEWNAAWLSDEEAAVLKQRIEAQIIKAKKRYEQDPELIGEYFRDVAPPIIFCLLPIFALLLKLLYIFKGMYYTQHLILAVHNHCFVFMWLSILTIIDLATLTIGGTPGLIEFLVGAWFVIYLWRSLRVVYQQGRFFTTVKFLILGISYLMLGGIAAALAIIFGGIDCLNCVLDHA